MPFSRVIEVCSCGARMFKRRVDAIRLEAASQTCESILFPAATATREKASRGGNGRGARLKSASHKICEKALIHDLPAFSADWQMPAKTALTAEVEAHFYYEFARESETILCLPEKLCHFTRRETASDELRGPSYPGEPLRCLHAHCASIAGALMPRINLRDVSWNHLKPEQYESLIGAFS